MNIAVLFFVSILLSQTICSQEVSEQILHPYKVGFGIDGTIIGISLVIAGTASALDDKIPQLTIGEINALSKKDINPIDRISAGNYSKEQSTISDVLVGISIVSPLTLLLDNDIREDAGIISTMYLETVLFAAFIPSYGKGAVKRIRPYAYGIQTPISEKLTTEARRSFFSGHATWAFATSIFFAKVYSDYFPNSEYKEYVWYGSIGLASTVSILRVTSGAHFISDITVGAAVGSTIGYIIPYLHRNNSENISLLPQISPQFKGFTLSMRLK